MRLKQYIHETTKFKYGDFITLKRNANVILSGTTNKMPPSKYVNDGGLWSVDHYEEESGMLNINRVMSPFPGAFCSWVHEDDVKKSLSEDGEGEGVADVAGATITGNVEKFYNKLGSAPARRRSKRKKKDLRFLI